MLTNFSYIRAKSLKEAMKQLSVPGARLHAGGTDLLGCLRDHVFDAKTVVSISGIRDFRGVKKTTGGGLSIGALTTVADVAASSLVKESYPALVKAALSVASPQLRNQGTIGGNICQKPRCWYYRGEFLCLRKGGKKCFAAGGENQYHCILGGGPCYIVHPSDVATALVAYEAMLHITGPKGSRVVPVEKFHVLPKVDVHRETVLEAGEIVTEIILPPAKEIRSSYRKIRARASWDFAIAGMALVIHFNNDVVTRLRAVLTAAAPIPWHSQEIEDTIIGNKLDSAIIVRAAKAAMAAARPLAQNDYKVPLFQGMIEEELTAFKKA